MKRHLNFVILKWDILPYHIHLVPHHFISIQYHSTQQQSIPHHATSRHAMHTTPYLHYTLHTI